MNRIKIMLPCCQTSENEDDNDETDQTDGSGIQTTVTEQPTSDTITTSETDITPTLTTDMTNQNSSSSSPAENSNINISGGNRDNLSDHSKTTSKVEEALKTNDTITDINPTPANDITNQNVSSEEKNSSSSPAENLNINISGGNQDNLSDHSKTTSKVDEALKTNDTEGSSEVSSHPGIGPNHEKLTGLFHAGGYEGPTSGNLWYEEGEEIENYIPGGAKGKGIKVPEVKYEYLDHTADVQLHCWGKNLKEAFEQTGEAMFGYMTENITTVALQDAHRFKAEGDDLEGLLYHFLDELLFMFAAEPFLIGRKVVIDSMDTVKFVIEGSVYGEPFDLNKHPAGTEIKAITYSAMQIYQSEKGDQTKKDKVEIYIIVDI